MDTNKVNLICMQMQDKVDPIAIASVKYSLEKMDDDKFDVVMASLQKLKNPTTVLILSFFLGGFGVDRFVLGKVGSGICKLLFGWITLGIWWLVDVIKAKENTRRYNAVKITEALLIL